MQRVTTAVLYVLIALGSGCRESDQPDAPGTAEVAVAPAPAEYSVDIAATPARPRAGEEVRITLRVATPSGSVLRPDPAVSSPVHLVAVSRDLAWYEHVHPRLDGEVYAARLRVPIAGEYVLHAIVLPIDHSQLVRKHVLSVGMQAGTTPLPLAISPRERRSGTYTIRLRSDPEPPAAGNWNSLIFHVSRAGEPVTNLTPTGTLGHIVILREGGEDFVYAHSTDGEAMEGVRARAHLPALPPRLDTHWRHTGDTGPEVTFHTQFPRAGRYKMWVEFLAGGEPIQADFVLDVGETRWVRR